MALALALAQLAPALLVDLDVVLLRRGLDPLPGLVALLVAHPLDLIEAGDGVAHVAGVLQGLLALLGKGEAPGRDLVALFGVQFGHGVALLSASISFMNDARAGYNPPP